MLMDGISSLFPGMRGVSFSLQRRYMPNDETPTVLHFVGAGHDVGGTLSYVRSLAPHNGVKNILIVQRGFEQTRRPFMKLLRIRKGQYSSIDSPGALFDALKQLPWLRKKLTRRPDLIFHGHSRSGVLIGMMLALLGYRNVVVTINNNGSQRWFYRLAYHILQHRMIFLCPSNKRHYGLPADSWRDCIPGTVTNAFRRPRPGRTRPPFFNEESGRVLVLGGCGLVVEWKAWEVILEALGCLSDDLRKRVRFVHVGDPLDEAISLEYAAKLRGLVEQHGLQDVVEWRGHQNDLNNFYAEIDLLVHPARNEPYGLVVVEALFAATPVLSSDSVGAADLIKPPENGLVFPSDDSRALANIIEQLLRGEIRFPHVERQSLRPLEPDYLGARWAEVYAKLKELPM